VAQSVSNGLKIPLVINSGMLIVGIFAAGILWNQQIGLAEDIKSIEDSPVTESRIVAIELNLKHLTIAVEKMGDEHEKSTREILNAIRDSD